MLAEGVVLCSVLAGFGFAYVIGLSIYRLYGSPLARFPGPKLAALTLWYEFYHDVVQGGKYIFEIEKMHKQYGPIVRINPYELHINDPKFYEELYPNTNRRKKRNKWHWQTRLFVADKASIGTVDHDMHRLRRNAISPFFSKANIRRLESLVLEKTQKLLLRMREFERTGEPLNLFRLYSAFSSDVIIEYAFGRCQDDLDKPDFNSEFFRMMETVHRLSPAAKQFGWLLPLLLSIPTWISSRLDRGLTLSAEFQSSLRRRMEDILARLDDPEWKSIPTIFHDICYSDLPASEKMPDRLWQEGQVIVAAGTETTAWTMTVTTFYLLRSPEKLQRLRQELRDARATSSIELEQLPYFTAVIQEGLRLAHGVSGRLSRISPDSPLIFRDGEKAWEIPAGIPVSMSSPLVHMNPDIFPSPTEFQPERWLNNKGLERYLVAFGKGSRQCVGMNLAYGELSIALSAIFSRYGPDRDDAVSAMSLYDTTVEDVQLQHDLFVAVPKLTSQGVRVTLSN